MDTRNSLPAGVRRLRLFAAPGALVLSAGLLLLAANSCSTTTTRTVNVPPGIPGATVAGTESCAQCHSEIVRDFNTSAHARLVASGPNASNVGCEACHGPGSKHNESGGVRGTIVNPNKSPDACFQCHLDMKSKFALPNHHPVTEGKMSCSDCHDPHRGEAILGGGTALMGRNDTCYRCHQAQRGPFVFEHEAFREGCVTCHEVHGSINQKMLTERNANLCLKCHFQQQTTPGQIYIGGRDHTTFLSRGTCWSAGCHEAMHGSQVNSSLRY